ncbi:MAG TPA: right-handed parallel beta-helix repeat-containing protein [Kofleriaceae bacterium]|jgi:hypothetical protein|nr:right-handed parallel beta-helix repeat-containing protein [Kofleriaceae bacterium]
MHDGPLVIPARRALCVAILIGALGPGCWARNCPHIVDNRCEDPSGDAGGPGASSAGCAGAGTPTCDAGRQCTAHTSCESNACLPDGTCAAEADVAYVEAGAPDPTPCSKATPCGQVATALATGKHYIKLHGTIDEGVTVDGGRSVTLLGDPGATLTRRSGAGPVVLATGTGTMLSIYDLTIADAGNVGVVLASSSAPSVALVRTAIQNNDGGGISVAGGSLTIAQSTISGNLGGGVAVLQSGRFDIVDSVFAANGGPDTATGAIAIAASPAAGNRLEFNTFYHNLAQDGVGAAIQCSAGSFVARNNILFHNGALSTPQQIGGSCDHAYSIVQPGVLPPGPGNQSADPRFVDPDASDFHLRPGSPAIEASDPSSDLSGATARDHDGVARARPATIGAYQPR